MSRFVVQFMKDVLGGNGREAEICQSSLEIDAANEGDARELAKKMFCETVAAPTAVVRVHSIPVARA